jgi:hypothetical protein
MSFQTIYSINYGITIKDHKLYFKLSQDHNYTVSTVYTI